MTKSFNVLFLLISIVTLFGGISYLTQSIYTGAVHHRLESLMVADRSSELKELSLLHPNHSSMFVTAHDLYIFAKYRQWQAFLSHSLNESADIEGLYQQSAILRPTWSETHVELSKIAMTQGEWEKAEKHLQLAQQFGLQKNSTSIAVIEQTYINWQRAEVKEKLNATQLLLSLAANKRYLADVDHMIRFSPAKVRLCNMLTFNRIDIPTCQPSN
ncbi:hypothetical protein [Vibrio fluminensis]|uniref:hypothetical protein n=1 Tax=Vibrio fluminensis TaxID=2783614 RepID=UPI001886F5F8|nr:hypothetical protein [Vibrio fluminensis]